MIAAATGFTIVRMKGGETAGRRRRAPGADGRDRRAGRGRLCEAGDRRRNRTQPEAADLFARQRERFTALYAAVKPESPEVASLLTRSPTASAALNERDYNLRAICSRGRGLDHQHVEMKRAVGLDGEVRLGLRRGGDLERADRLHVRFGSLHARNPDGEIHPKPPRSADLDGEARAAKRVQPLCAAVVANMRMVAQTEYDRLQMGVKQRLARSIDIDECRSSPPRFNVRRASRSPASKSRQ